MSGIANDDHPVGVPHRYGRQIVRVVGGQLQLPVGNRDAAPHRLVAQRGELAAALKFLGDGERLQRAHAERIRALR